MTQSRRTFFKTAGAAVATAAIAQDINTPAIAGEAKLTLGMASYTLREFNLDDTLAMTKRLGLTKIAFKSFHLPLDASVEEIKAVKAKVEEAGLDLYGGGVIYMKSEEEVKNAFAYAQAAGMRVIIGVPNHNLLDLVEEKVKETGIILAIHNHGPGDKVYPSPESAYEKLKGRDERMGLCIDIGHTQRIGLDPAKDFVKFKDRVFDIHIKDVTASTAEGNTTIVGRGVIDIPGFLKTLVKHKYDGIVSLEYEAEGKDPLAGCAESIGYTRGVLAML
jgi:sugar phosphate isomerase/epimerase